MEPQGCHREGLIQRDGLWSLMQKQDGFSMMERSSEKNSDLRSRVNCEGVETGVKGRDERQKTAPLTPVSTPKRFFALFSRKRLKKSVDNADAVIHGHCTL